MDCQELQKFIHAYLDGEFAEEDRVAYAAHLHSCCRCRGIARFEERFRARLKEQQGGGVQASPELRARVCRALQAEEHGGEHWARRSLRVIIPAAAAAALVTGVVLSRRVDLSQVDALASLAEESVQWHRQEVPFDVVGSSMESVRRFFSNKVPFAIRPPTFGEPEVKLVGARLSNLREHRAAYLAYLVGRNRVSVFIVDQGALPQAGGQVMRLGTRDVQWHPVRGYNVAMFVDGGTGYAVASDMERHRLVRLIAHVR
ncbi:MAG: hypothetical protein IT371_15075 [Deltaproteobacteria bacterium]|nr:hypothetical protein [Deltaproteobacteria bacterium]